MADIFPSNYPDSLAGTINLTQDNVIGSPEKHDISKLVKDANCFALRRDESGLSGWIATHPECILGEIGNILNTVMESNCPFWVEGNFDDLLMYAGSDFSEQYKEHLEGSDIGFLFFKETEDILGCIICWSRNSYSDDDIGNITICPVVQHIDVKRFILLNENMKPSILDALKGKRINSQYLKKLGNIFESLSMGISSSFLEGIIEDAVIINNKQNNEEWKNSYIKLSGSFATRLIFFGIGALTTVILNSEDVLRAPGYITYQKGNLFWRESGSILDMPDSLLTPYVTGQVSLKMVSSLLEEKD